MNITAIRKQSLMSLVALGVLLVALSGCSSFNRDFEALRAQSAPANDIAGAWVGTWVSDGGHNGELRCILTPLPDTAAAGQKRYHARFHATYAKILSYSYAMELTAQQRDDAMHFKGEADLGWLAGGVYQCEGQATPEVWESTYSSKHDHGRFDMTRAGQDR